MLLVRWRSCESGLEKFWFCEKSLLCLCLFVVVGGKHDALYKPASISFVRVGLLVRANYSMVQRSSGPVREEKEQRVRVLTSQSVRLKSQEVTVSFIIKV